MDVNYQQVAEKTLKRYDGGRGGWTECKGCFYEEIAHTSWWGQCWLMAPLFINKKSRSKHEHFMDYLSGRGHREKICCWEKRNSEGKLVYCDSFPLSKKPWWLSHLFQSLWKRTPGRKR